MRILFIFIVNLLYQVLWSNELSLLALPPVSAMRLLRFIGNEDINWDWLAVGLIGWRSFVSRIKQLDVTAEDAADRLDELIRDLGGMDIFLLSSGIGNQNKYLDTSIEQATIQTNVTGFTRMVLAAYRYFSSQGGGHISVISSIAGTKGLGVAPSYSATKRYQNIYIDALAQLSRMEKQPITFTDIRPGFVRTDLLKDGRNYPMLMSPQYAALRIANAIDRKKRRAIIDWRYAILVFFWRLIPEWLWEWLPIRN